MVTALGLQPTRRPALLIVRSSKLPVCSDLISVERADAIMTSPSNEEIEAPDFPSQAKPEAFSPSMVIMAEDPVAN